jgi:hypothetical protein
MTRVARERLRSFERMRRVGESMPHLGLSCGQQRGSQPALVNRSQLREQALAACLRVGDDSREARRERGVASSRACARDLVRADPAAAVRVREVVATPAAGTLDVA